MDISKIIEGIFTKYLSKFFDYGILGLIALIFLLFIVKKIFIDNSNINNNKDLKEIKELIEGIDDKIVLLENKIKTIENLNTKRYQHLYMVLLENKNIEEIKKIEEKDRKIDG